MNKTQEKMFRLIKIAKEIVMLEDKELLIALGQGTTREKCEDEGLSLCDNCNCMTKTFPVIPSNGKFYCGKCGCHKPKPIDTKSENHEDSQIASSAGDGRVSPRLISRNQLRDSPSDIKSEQDALSDEQQIKKEIDKDYAETVGGEE